MKYWGDQSHRWCSQQHKELFEEKNNLKNKLPETSFVNKK